MHIFNRAAPVLADHPYYDQSLLTYHLFPYAHFPDQKTDLIHSFQPLHDYHIVKTKNIRSIFTYHIAHVLFIFNHEHGVNKPSEIYTNEIPAFLQTALENGVHRILPESCIPPSLPPHLEKVILNSNSTMKDDQSVLPNPNHVVLNHLAASSIRNGVLAVSVTTRFRNKYITTVLYRPISV
ncbi:hypothetical protein PCK2_000404 [Pneumocystis canis]|nr:hypothetical protein PCK2_000404 [Pneumocystis canis]